MNRRIMQQQQQTSELTTPTLKSTTCQPTTSSHPMTRLILPVALIVASCCCCLATEQQQQQETLLLSESVNVDNHETDAPNNRLSEKYYKYQQLQHQKQLEQLQLQQQQQHYAFSNNSISVLSPATGKIQATKDYKKSSAAMQHHHGLNKLQKYLNERQNELIKRNPGSLLAVARALKMAIVECQYQMRHEPWDCPIYGFSIKPSDVFGRLMSRSFKETSFIRSLLSSAIAHSIARACTESMINTCGRKATRDGGFSEDIEFGRQFATQFMIAMHELPQQVATSASTSTSTSTNSLNSNINNNEDLIINGRGSNNDLNNNIIAAGNNLAGNEAQHQQQAHTTSGSSIPRGILIRDMINEHNDEVGRLVSS